MTAHLKDPSVRAPEVADDTTLIGLIQDGDESAYRQEVKELAVWCSLNNLELNTLKTVEMIVDFRRKPPCSPPTHHHEQHGDCSGVIQVPGHHISQDLKWVTHIDSIVRKAQQRLYFLRQLRKFNLPQELLKQFYSAIIESVLCTSITVWFSLSYQIWPQKTTEGSPDCWANRWYNPPYSPRTVLIQSEQKGCKITLDPHIQHTPSLNCCRLVERYTSSEHQNDQTQEQFLSPKQSISWTPDINVEHTTLFYNYLFTTHTYIIFFI